MARIVRLLGVALTLIIGSGVLPAAGVSRAQIDGAMRDRILPAAVLIAIMVDVTENGSTEPVWIPVGSGTIVSPSGLVLTAWHVADMEEQRTELDRWEREAAADGDQLSFDLDEEQLLILNTVGIGEAEPAWQAETVAEHHGLDLAVLQIVESRFDWPLNPETLDLPYVPLGDSGELRQGDAIHVFGYPAIGGGTLQYTAGVVSGFGFEVGISGPARITTDASISGGSSGGTATDAAGRLIGVPTQGGELDCRPGDTNLDGEITAEDVGCIPTGGSIGQLRPINLAKPMLAKAGLVESEEPGEETATPAPTEEAEATKIATVAPTVLTPTPAPTKTARAATTTRQATETPVSSGAGDVPMYGVNVARTGEMPGPAPRGNLGVLWSLETGYEIFETPSLVDGMLYVTGTGADNSGGGIIAVDARSGEERWRREVPSILAPPTIADGWLYAMSADQTLHVLDTKGGSTILSRDLNLGSGCFAGSSPLVVGDVVVVSIGCPNPEDETQVDTDDLGGILLALDRVSGTEQWRFPYRGFASRVAPATASGLIVIADEHKGAVKSSGAVYAVNVESGNERWRFQAAEGLITTPIIAEGNVYVASEAGTLYALDLASGLERWRFDLEGELGAQPAVGEGVIYVGSWGGATFAIDAATGDEIGRIPGQYAREAIALTEDALVVGDSCGVIFVIDREQGGAEQAYDPGECSYVTSPVVSDEVIYYGTLDGELVALGSQRPAVPISEGMAVEVVGEEVVLRAAPSSSAVIRAPLPAGTAAEVTGESEEREGVTWWPIAVEGIGEGWVHEEELVVAESVVAPTPTPLP